MEQKILGYLSMSPLSIGIGIGIVITLFLRCVLFHGDPLSCLRCLLHVILGFIFISKANNPTKTSNSPVSFSSPSSSESNCGSKKSANHDPPSAEGSESHLGPLEKQRISLKEIEMVMQRLGIFSIDPDGKEAVVGPGEIERMFEDQEPSLEEVKEAFDVFDKNHDGFIDAAELRDVLLGLGIGEVSEMGCEKLIGAFDENRDGLIDFREFIKLVEKSLCFS